MTAASTLSTRYCSSPAIRMACATRIRSGGSDRKASAWTLDMRRPDRSRGTRKGSCMILPHAAERRNPLPSLAVRRPLAIPVASPPAHQAGEHEDQQVDPERGEDSHRDPVEPRDVMAVAGADERRDAGVGGQRE